MQRALPRARRGRPRRPRCARPRVRGALPPGPALPALAGDRRRARLRRPPGDRRATSRSASSCSSTALLLQLVWPLEALGWILNLGAARDRLGGPHVRLARCACRALPEAGRARAAAARASSSVRFENVRFAYAGGEPRCCCDIDLESRPARSSPSAARPARASRRCSTCCRASTTPTRRHRARRRRRRCATLRMADLRTRRRAGHAARRCCSRCRCARTSARRARTRPRRTMLAACEVAGRRRRFIDRPARRLRHAHRRARRQPLGRPAPARRAGARADLERPRARARRPALGGRHRDRGAASCARLRPALAGRTVLLASAAPLDRLAGRPRRRARGRRDRRGRHRRAELLDAGGTFERLFGDEVRVRVSRQHIGLARLSRYVGEQRAAHRAARASPPRFTLGRAGPAAGCSSATPIDNGIRAEDEQTARSRRRDLRGVTPVAWVRRLVPHHSVSRSSGS